MVGVGVVVNVVSIGCAGVVGLFVVGVVVVLWCCYSCVLVLSSSPLSPSMLSVLLLLAVLVLWWLLLVSWLLLLELLVLFGFVVGVGDVISRALDLCVVNGSDVRAVVDRVWASGLLRLLLWAACVSLYHVLL